MKFLQVDEQELHETALEFKKCRDWNNYFVFMTMSANLGYPVAVYELIRSNFSKQDYKVTLKHTLLRY
jgi:hypothetical protein